jgi:hypothetical protein
MEQASHPGDLEQLQRLYEDWVITAAWSAAASGPDRRHLTARKGSVVLSAFSADDLAALIAAEVLVAALRREEAGE